MTTDPPQATTSSAAAFPRFVPPPVLRTTLPASAQGAKISEDAVIRDGERGSWDSNPDSRFWRPRV